MPTRPNILFLLSDEHSYRFLSARSGVKGGERGTADLHRRYAARVKPRTPNQILRGDGVLVEADAPLYLPHVVSPDPAADFADFDSRRIVVRNQA